MSMDNKFDEILRKKLNNYDSSYPDSMWESIANKLPEKKRKPYYLWFIVIFLALAFYGVTYYSFNQLQKQNSSESTKEAANVQVPLGGHSGNHVENTSGAGNGSSITSAQIENITDAGSTSNNANLHGRYNNAFSNAVSTKAHSAAKNNINKTSSQQLIASSKNSNANSITSEAQHSGVNTNETLLAQDVVADGSNRADLSFLTLPGNGADPVHSNVAQQALKTKLGLISKKHATLACPTFVRKQNLTTFEVYFSNDFAERTLSVKRGDGIGYLNQREKTEFSHLSNSFGFRVGMGWESGIAFKTGLNYSNINEKFVYTDPNSIQKKTITIVKYIYDNMLNVVDSTITQEIVEIPGTNTIITKNRYSFVDIPVLFQYSLKGKKRLSYDVTVGPYINLLFAQNGKILNQDGKSVIVLGSEIGNQQFKNNIGLSFYGSFAINYQLTKEMKISFEPNIRYMTNSITSYSNNLDQRYITAGVAAGIKLKI